MNRGDGITSENRAVTAVIGFILIFGILVISFSLYQATVVPQQNGEVEFEQYQEVQEQMVDLRTNILLMQDSTSTRSAAVDLGVRYPSRTVFVNPGPASARLQTAGADNRSVNLTIQNATAVGSEGAGETADFWDGTPIEYNTSVIEFRPDYNRFQGALPIVYEHGLAHTQVDSGAGSVPLTQQSLVEGNQISVLALNGSLREGGIGTASVDIEPLSTRSEVVEVENTDGPITLEFASRMNVSTWNESLENQLVPSGGHVESVDFVEDGPGEFSILEITLEENQRYEIQLAKVGLGTGTTETTERYLTPVEGTNSVVEPGSAQQLTVEARDKFNTPQSGVNVSADPSGGSFDGNNTRETGPDGRTTFVYEPRTDGTHRVNFTITDYTPDDSHDPSTGKNVSIRVTVPKDSSGSNSAGGSGSGSSTYDVTWEDPDDQSGVSGSSSPYEYDASKAGEITLTMATDPVLDGASVDYAVSNQSRATVNPDTGETNSNGTSSTQLQPEGTGLVTVYTTSGNDGDTLQFNITNVRPPLANDRTLVYESNSGDLSVINGTGGEIRTPGQTGIAGLGGPEAGLSSAGDIVFPYVDSNGNLQLTNVTGSTETLVDSSSSQSPRTGKTIMATGVWNESDNSVFYAGTQADRLYRVAPGGSSTEVVDPSNGVKGVVDTGDIDGDSETELVFVDGSSQIRYLNQDGSINKLDNAGIGSNNAIGAGDVLRLNGTVWTVIIDGNRNLALVTDDGKNRKGAIQTQKKPRKAPPTAADVDSDGETELVYIANGKRLKYVNNPLDNPTTKRIEDANGQKVQVTEEPGVVSP